MKICIAVAASLPIAGASLGQVTIGERPAIMEHLSQAEIEAGTYKLKELVNFGRELFEARFNILDGQGRPGSTGTGADRDPAGQPNFHRISGPDASSCMGCHSQAGVGGGSEFGPGNVFVLAQAADPVLDTIDPMFSNERGSIGMHGSGPIEMLAREMTTELIAIREEAKSTAMATGVAQTRALMAKGVSFGEITVLADGRIDPTGIEGVDWDLIIKPFHQKGAVVSLRQFTNNAMNHHFGMQPVERFGTNTDPDLDGVMNELTVGDITAATLFQAALQVPGRVMPREPERIAAALRGESLFAAVGCTSCHVPSFTLESRYFTEPNPFNPAGNAGPGDIGTYSFDLTRGKGAPRPRLERAPGGRAVIRPFTDLKRHDLTDEDYAHFGNEQVPQGMINGFADPADFTVAPYPRPTAQFLTRKLWDAGNTDPYGHRNDLTTMTEAIHFHGGDARAERDAFFALPPADQAAIIEFLRTLQVPEGTAKRVSRQAPLR